MVRSLLRTDNAPTFYRELKDNNVKRFRTMVSYSFSLLILLYITIMTAGYSTFGDTCKCMGGKVTNNSLFKDMLLQHIQGGNHVEKDGKHFPSPALTQ